MGSAWVQGNEQVQAPMIGVSVSGRCGQFWPVSSHVRSDVGRRRRARPNEPEKGQRGVERVAIWDQVTVSDGSARLVEDSVENTQRLHRGHKVALMQCHDRLGIHDFLCTSSHRS
jgi:hypothetical protein